MKKQFSPGRVAFFFVGTSSMGIVLILGPLPPEASSSAIEILSTVLSILAGFLIAIITMIGDPKSLLTGNWRIGSLHHREIWHSMNRFTLLFYLYLATIGIAFSSALFERSIPDGLHRWIEHVAISLGTGAIVLSFGLPQFLRREQKLRLSEEVENRKAQSSAK